VKNPIACLLLALVTVSAGAQEAPDEAPDPNWRPKEEQRILNRLNAAPDLRLRCDFVLNAATADGSFRVPVAGKITVLNFWRPSCGPCKPLLSRLGAYSRTGAADLVVLGAAEGGKLYGEPVGVVKARELISGIVSKYAVPFPVCGYTDHLQTKAWQAEGVPLTVVFDAGGRVRRVAFGGDEGLRVVEQLEGGWRP